MWYKKHGENYAESILSESFKECPFCEGEVIQVESVLRLGYWAHTVNHQCTCKECRKGWLVIKTGGTK